MKKKDIGLIDDKPMFDALEKLAKKRPKAVIEVQRGRRVAANKRNTPKRSPRGR